MPRPANVDHVCILRLDDPVQMRIDEIEPRRRAPMPKQPWLDMLDPQRLTQQRVVQKINLPDRQVVCGAPVGIYVLQIGV